MEDIIQMMREERDRRSKASVAAQRRSEQLRKEYTDMVRDLHRRK